MNITEKSRLTSFFLTLLFGPLGLFYSSMAGAIALSILAVASYATIIGPILCWMFAMGIGDHCVVKHNKNAAELKDILKNKN